MPLVLQRSGQFAAVCDRCLAGRKAFLGPDRPEARDAVLALGWQEHPRPRGRGELFNERADWWCPACVAETTK